MADVKPPKRQAPKAPRVPTYDETQFDADEVSATSEDFDSHMTRDAEASAAITAESDADGTGSAAEPALQTVGGGSILKSYAILISDELIRPDVPEVVALEADGLSIPWPEGLSFTDAVKAWSAGEQQEKADEVSLDIPIDADEIASWSEDEWKVALTAIEGVRGGAAAWGEIFTVAGLVQFVEALGFSVDVSLKEPTTNSSASEVMPTLLPGHHWEMVSDDIREVTRSADTGQFTTSSATEATVTQHFPEHRQRVDLISPTVNSRFEGLTSAGAADVIDKLITELRYHVDVHPTPTLAAMESGALYAEYLRAGPGTRTEAEQIEFSGTVRRFPEAITEGTQVGLGGEALNTVGEGLDQSILVEDALEFGLPGYTVDEDDEP